MRGLAGSTSGTCVTLVAMAQPEFTPYERYLISMYKAGVGASLWVTWMMVAAATLVFLAGLGKDDGALLFTGFGLLVFWEIYSNAQQPAGMRAMRSVIEKYEARIEELACASERKGSA
jgi:hypothetical protein